RVGIDAERCRYAGIRARQVSADLRPAPPAVDGLVKKLRGVEQDVRVGRREEHRRRADEPILAATDDDRTDVLEVASPLVEARDLPAVDDAGMQRIRRRIAVLLDAYRMPLAERDLAEVAARRDAGRSALLLPSVQPVRESVVGSDVEHLCGRLVVPRTPRL